MKSEARYRFPPRLIRQLGGLAAHTLTVVEAPSGFGKTTAVREYLAGKGCKLGYARWYTCLGESPDRAWAGICDLFKDLPGSRRTLADDLLELGVPRPETLPDMAALFHDYRCAEKYCLVIDNYQLFEHASPRKFLSLLSDCYIENLHIIVITQPLKDEPLTTHNLHHRITTMDFVFNKANILKFCQLKNITISAEQAEHIQIASDGWIAAICLQLKHYKETGLLTHAQGIETLVETAVWNRLSSAEKDFMVALSLLDGFTPHQAAIIGGTAMPDSIRNLLLLEFFMRYVGDKHVYSIHAILRNYLLQRFAMQAPEVMENMRRRAASACLSAGDCLQAAVFLKDAGDYDAVLSLPFSTQYFYNNKSQSLVSFFENLVDACPQDILQRHPIMAVRMAYLFFREGSPSYFVRLTNFLRAFFEQSHDLPADHLARAQAEFYMLVSFTEYNDIIKMSTWHRKAYAALLTLSDHPRSEVFQGTMPWAVGVASYIAVYWNSSGKLRQELDAMDDCLPIYSELASGHGAGAEHVFRAEATLACGCDVEAESLCHKALYRAHNAGQVGVCLCSEVLLAEIALLRGDAELYAATRLSIARTAEESGQRSVLRMGELCLAVLDLGMGITDNAPLWLHSVEGIRKTLYAHAVPYGLMVYGHLLLHQKHDMTLRGLAGQLDEISHSTNVARNMNYVLLQVYRAIYLTIVEARTGHAKKALPHLQEALALALPDNMYLPFAKFSAALLPLLSTIEQQGGYSSKDIQELTDFCKRYARGTQQVRSAAQLKLYSALTQRESEVARLAKERMSVGEMAIHLNVSPNTVKTLLKKVYHKLGVKGKTQLR